MSDIDYIIRYTQVLKPEIIKDIDYHTLVENLKQDKNTNLYILLPEKYQNLDLFNISSEEVFNNENSLLFLIILVKRLIDSNIISRIVLDSAEDIEKLQEMSRVIQFVEKDEYGNTTTGPFSNIRIVRSNDYGYKTYYSIYKGKRVPYSPFAKNIIVSAQGEGLPSEPPFDVIIYLKRNEQFYKSGFPKFVSPEYRINQIKEIKCPLVVIVTTTLSIPRDVSDLNILCVSAKSYTKREIKFEPVSWDSYFSFNITNDKILKLLDDFDSGLGKLYFCAGILFILYDDSPLHINQINESVIIRMTDNLTLRNRVRDLFQELTNYKAELGILKPNIASWADIYTLRKEIEKSNIKIQYAKPLEKSMVAVFGYLFSDIILLNKLFTLSKGISNSIINFEDLDSKTKDIINKEPTHKIESGKQHKDFDPEAPIGYIASEYKTSEVKGPVEAHYFVLESKGEKYIFYCQLGKNSTVKVEGSSKRKSLDQLKEGDVIEKKYWNYPLLKTKIIEAIETGKIESSETLLKDIAESDSFREFIEKYALSKSNSELDAKYAYLVDYSVKNFLRRWSIETMRPRKEDLFVAVTHEINKLYNCNFDADSLLKKLQKIKNCKKLVDTDNHDGDTIGYKIAKGPIKIRIEVEKLGRIYRLS